MKKHLVLAVNGLMPDAPEKVRHLARRSFLRSGISIVEGRYVRSFLQRPEHPEIFRGRDCLFSKTSLE